MSKQNYWDKPGQRGSHNSQATSEREMAQQPTADTPTLRGSRYGSTSTSLPTSTVPVLTTTMAQGNLLSVITTQPTGTSELTSTPANSPRHGGGRSEDVLSSFDMSNFSNFDANNTPFGEGIHQQLQSSMTDREDTELLSLPEDDFEKLIQTENEEVMKYGDQYRETIDWKIKLGPAALKTTKRIEKLLKAAKTLKRTTHINRLFAMRRTLRESVIALTAIIDREKETQTPFIHLSPSLLDPSASLAAASVATLASTGSTLPAGIHPITENLLNPNAPLAAATVARLASTGSPLPAGTQPITEHRSEEGEYSHQNPIPTDSNINVNPKPSKPNPFTLLQDLGNRIDKLERFQWRTQEFRDKTDPAISKIQRTITEMISKDTRLEGRMVTKAELDVLLQRICALELQSKGNDNLLQKVHSLQETCNGLLEENMEITRKVQAAEGMIGLMQVAQRTNSNQQMPAARQQPPTTTAPVTFDRLCNATTASEQPSYIRGMGTLHPEIPQPQVPRVPQPGTNPLAGAMPNQNDIQPIHDSSRLVSHRTEVAEPPSSPDGSLCESTESTKSYATYADYVKERLRLAGQSLLTLLTPEMTSSLSKNKVASLHKSTLNVIISERRELEKLMDKYERFPADQIQTSALYRAGEILSDARDWCTTLISKYDELDCANKPVDSKLFEGLGVFTEDSETSIYEFLKKFDTFMEDMGSKTDRASLLYEQHLDENIKLLTVHLRGDLDKLKAWLLKRFGEPRNMCENILKPISKGNPPPDTYVTSGLLHHYRSLNAAMKRIDELQHLPGIPLGKLKSHIEGTDFLTSIMDLLPNQASKDFFALLYEKDVDLINIQGPTALQILTSVITRHSKMIEGRAQSCGVSSGSKSKQIPKQDKEQPRRSRAAHATTNINDDDSDDAANPKAHHYEKPPNRQRDNRGQTQTKPSSPQKTQKSRKDTSNKSQNQNQNSLIFPCCLSGHNHELGECKTFFGSKCRKRMFLAENKCCFTCLKPFSKCRTKCQNDVPDVLLCKECEPESIKRNKTPLNVLLCPNLNHKKDLDELKVQTALKKYLPGFDPSILVNGKTIVNHILLSAHVSKTCPSCKEGKCSCSPTSKTRKPDPKQETPNLNTLTGEKVKVDNSRVVEESPHDAFYVMQTLNLRGQDVLTFYDSGANHHMIKGEIAEDVDLKVVTDKPVNVGVVGGGSVWTSYGTYALSLGPTQNGFFHNISAQGITQITDKFPRYSLQEVNDEVNSTTQYPFESLPKYVGGQEAGLLIGIKDTGLQPTLLFQLPSGLGVYESPLMDKFGSRICYGGPHRVFSEANKIAGCFNHVSLHFTKLINQYKNSLYPMLSEVLEPEYDELGDGIMVPKDRSPCIKIQESSSYSLYVTALDETDLQEMGIPVEEPVDTVEDKCTCGGVYSTVTMMEDQHPTVQAFKAKIPLSRKKLYFDQDDVEQTHSLRCEDCVRCKKCGQSARTRMISLQEKVEQEAIERSVTIDLEARKTWVDLPFLKDPIPSLKAKHKGKDNNYYQALRVYKDQCKKPEIMRKEFNKVHADLVNRGFMMKLQDLPEEHQTIIRESGFRHVMPWRIQEKPDSLSTPIRMVVDGTMTGLNQLLAKGENRMSKISSIMIRNRCKRKTWTSDVSKLYNQLHLQPEALPFCLFLFKEDLNIHEEPDTYVMTRAWYGISPVGNQAGESLGQLTSTLEDSHPEAKRIVDEDLYVDDAYSGASTDEEVNEQIRQVKDALGQGGFTLKYVVKSGEKPCAEASGNGVSLKILGYIWKPEDDIMFPGFEELNFNKKKRGAKKPNAFPVVSPADVVNVLKEVKISRRLVASKMAEFWDPIGLWEPFKLQLKLDNHLLKGMEWDFELPEDLQDLWTTRFKEMLQIPYFSAPRCVVPVDAVDPTKLRLICLSDAAEEAGGCCIYTSYECRDGSYSCSLITSRSKLLDQKVPRNELEAVRIMAETAITVKEALKDMVTDVIYVTDSTIALCWCNNLQKKLKIYTLFRVAEIRRNILGEVFPPEGVKLPLYHIDGTLNPADLVTKRHEITPKNIGPGSTWQNGEKWMSLPFNQMPLTTYDDLKISKAEESEIKTECFPELIMTKSIHAIYPPQDAERSHTLKVMHASMPSTFHCKGCNQSKIFTPMDTCYGTADVLDHCLNCECTFTLSSFSLKRGGDSHMIIDVIKYGWPKSLAVLTTMYKFIFITKHRVHMSKGQVSPHCKLCQFTSEATLEIESEKIFKEEAKNYIFRKETCRIVASSSKKSLEQFMLQDGILYYQSRLKEEVKAEELDCKVFFDEYSIKEFLPVVLSDSDVFFSFLMHVHHNVRPHAGVEITMKEVSKVMMVIKNPRKVIQSVRQTCQVCRSIRRKTVELRMLNHPAARTILAPPYYIAQMDTVFGFRAQVFKNARKTVKIYALIICCLLTGATNILVIEGLETKDVLQAIERHATRHGMPSVLYVDNGTNLIALQHATFSVRDLNCQLSDSYGIQVRVSNAKSHEERGRVEARVKIMRGMLEKLCIKADAVLSVLQWENLFSRISNMINDLPIAKCTRSNVTDPGWDIITPNRLLLGRNNMRSIEGWISLSKAIGSENLLRKNQAIMNTWYKLFADRIHHLIPRPNKWTKNDRIQEGDICLFMYNEAPGVGKDHWKLGRVSEILKPNKVVISYPGKSKKKELPKLKTLERCPRDIAIIHAAADIDLNTREYLESLFKKD